MRRRWLGGEGEENETRDQGREYAVRGKARSRKVGKASRRKL